MRKKLFFITVLCGFIAGVSGCKTVRVEGPQATITPVKPQLQMAKHSLKTKSINASQIPPVLGGVIQSDSWIIYKDKQQEEFSGNVSYDNGTYLFRADYALSERALNRFSARGNVYLRQNETTGAYHEVYAHRAQYNYKTQKGTVSAKGKSLIQLIYTDEKQNTAKAYAQKASFDLAQKVFVLEGNVRIERPTEQGTQTLTAQKATVRQLENYALLEGGATASDGKRTLQAQTLIYDGAQNRSYAKGARPLAYGETEQGTFAIIADEVQSDNEGTRIRLDGKVQGWLVSPQINASDINNKF